MAQNLDNGPGSVSGGEPVVKALTVSSIAAAIVSIGASVGLDLDPTAVLVLVVAVFGLATMIGARRARRSVTPNGNVVRRR